MKPNTILRRRRQAFSVLSVAALMLITLAACPSRSTPAPLPTLPPTSTPAPSATPTPTWTPAPRPTSGPLPTATPSYLVTTVAAGETIEVGDLVLTVTQIPAPASETDAEAGRQLVLLDLTIQNVSDRVIGINSARELILKDSSDQVYRISAAALAAIEGTTPDVDLAPNEVIRAQVGFSVPAEASGLTLSFAADKFNAGRIFVRLP